MKDPILVSLECGHTHLASKVTLSVLPSGFDTFMISTPVVGESMTIVSRRGTIVTSKVTDIRCTSLDNGTSYLRVTTQNSVLSLIAYI